MKSKTELIFSLVNALAGKVRRYFRWTVIRVTRNLVYPSIIYVTIRGINSVGLDAQMALIRLRQANEAGEEIGVLLINPDQIVSIIVFNNVTEIHTVDGKAQWVKETPDEVASKIQNPR